MTDEAAEAREEAPKKRRMPKKKGKKKPSTKKKTKKKVESGGSKPASGAEGDRYLCVHCGHKFMAEAEPKRCPSCMRKGGLELLEEKSGDRKTWKVPAIVLGAVAVIAIGYVAWSRSTPDAVSGEVPLEPLSFSELRGYLRDKDADGDHAHLFDVNDAIETLASNASGDSPQAKAEALTSHIRSRSSARAFVNWAMDTPRDTPVHNAGWAAEQLATDEGDVQLYPLEVAAAAVAALREEGVDAMVAEVWGYPGDRVPPDPSGFLGYFAVAVYDGEVGEGTPTIHDPYGGHSTQPEEDSYRVLNDAQAAAAMMGIDAVYHLVHENDAVRALDRSRRALRVDERAPYLRTVQGKVLVAGAGVQQGIEELQAASQIRPDAPRRNNLAGVFVVMNDVDQAAREAAAALERFPDFAAAHATLAAIHLAQGENDLARGELVIAERLEPRLLNLPMLWANYYLQTGEQMQAVGKAREAVERNPNNWETRFQAARLYRMVGRYGPMRREARKIMELVQPEQQALVRQRILELLGPTALEEEDDDLLADLDDEDLEDFDDEDLGGGGSLELESELFGGGGGETGGPSLLDEELGGGGFDLGGGGGGAAGGFQLGGGGGGGLRLNLNE
ncbi:MAG: hypothetical protein AAGE52_00665 [Myxococcota bacterium]